jgi:hypothetical protein
MYHFDPTDFSSEDKLMYFPLIVSVVLNVFHILQTPEFYQSLLYVIQFASAAISLFFGLKKLVNYIIFLFKKK